MMENAASVPANDWMEESIEINFQLDREGRTSIQRESADVKKHTDDSKETPITRARSENDMLDYATRIYATQFATSHQIGEETSPAVIDPSTSQLYRELLLDCDIADSGLMPRTFWVPSSSAQPPRCTLEHMAKDIFDFYVRDKGIDYDPTNSGAEWWIQIRPSPESTGRYAMHAPDVGGGVDLHWDKDEELRILCGGSTYVHPHWSTVTYLSSVGAPTLVAEGRRVNNLTGEWILSEDDADDSSSDVILSWPSRGKHLCFDGRWLHGAPSDLAEEQGTAENRRYSFLVNIWLNHRPLQVEPFPACMLSKLSGHEGSAKESCRPRIRLKFAQEETKIPIVDGETQQGSDKQSCSVEGLSRISYSWPLGDERDGANATIVTCKPLQELLKQHGTTIRLRSKTGLALRKDVTAGEEGAKRQKLEGNQ